MLSDTTAKSIIYSRQNQDPPPNYNRRSIPSNVAQNSPSVTDTSWKTSSSGSNQTPSITTMGDRNDYWQKPTQFQPQYQQQNVLQTTAMFHELENKLDKVINLNTYYYRCSFAHCIVLGTIFLRTNKSYYC